LITDIKNGQTGTGIGQQQLKNAAGETVYWLYQVSCYYNLPVILLLLILRIIQSSFSDD